MACRAIFAVNFVVKKLCQNQRQKYKYRDFWTGSEFSDEFRIESNWWKHNLPIIGRLRLDTELSNWRFNTPPQTESANKHVDFKTKEWHKHVHYNPHIQALKDLQVKTRQTMASRSARQIKTKRNRLQRWINTPPPVTYEDGSHTITDDN